MPRGDTHKAWGMAHRRRIVEKLATGPMSAQDLANALHLTRGAVLLHIRVLREEKQIRIAGHVMQRKTREIPLYGLGSEPDAEYVKAKHIPAPNSFEVQRAKVRADVLAQLKIARATSPELAVLLGLSDPTMRKYLPKMHAEGLIHRAAWVKKEGGGRDVAVWAAGNAPDAPKGNPMKKRVWAVLSDEQRDLLRRRRAVVDIIRHAKKKPQGIFAALGI